MSEQPSAATLRLLVGIMIGASIALIGLAGWMHARHVGAPGPLAVIAAGLAALSAVLALKARRTS